MGKDLSPLASKSRLYRVASARIAGSSHSATSTPCQDFAAGQCTKQMAAAALADGAGSRALSEFGAQAVVKSSLRLLTAQFDALYEMCSRDINEARRHVHAHLMLSLQRQAARQACAIGELASTLLFVAHKGERFLAGHLGDGVIAQVDCNGVVSALSNPENGEYANTTYFVTDSSAAQKIRLYHGAPSQRHSGFALMSDGSAESLYDKQSGALAPAIAKLVAWNRTLSRTKMNGVLNSNMEQWFSKKTTDDCSLALLSIRPNATEGTLNTPSSGTVHSTD